MSGADSTAVDLALTAGWEIETPQCIGILVCHNARHTLGHDGEHMQRVQVALPTTSCHVQRHGRLSIGRCPHYRGLSQLPHSCRQEGADDRATLKPDAQGWHLEHRILGQDRDQGFDVGIFECRHVSVEQRSLSRLGRFDQSVVIGGKTRTRPLQRTVDRRHADIQQRRDF